MTGLRRRLAVFSILLLSGCSLTADVAAPNLHRLSFGLFGSPKPTMVASAHPYATRAGLDVMARGGSAVDAAIAVALVLTVVEPEASGIGGGTFLLYWDEAAQSLMTYDGRETAPQSAPETLFLDDKGKPKPFFDKVLGGQSVGVPGAIALYAKAHDAHGNLPWADLFTPAIDLAENGFEVSPKLNRWLTRLPTVERMPQIKGYFTDNGLPYPVGATLKNPDLAHSLRLIAAQGPDAFYRGAITDEIIENVAHAPLNPATLTRADFAAYEAKVRGNLCGPYRQYTVCSMPAPSSGGLTLLQILGLLEATDFDQQEPGSAKAWHMFVEASRVAFADRDFYIADPDFVDVPSTGLIDKAYLAARAQLINKDHFGGKASHGVPPGAASDPGEDASPELPSTSHFAVVDAQGNAVTATATVEFAFGSHLMAGGFILNNELTDFSAVPEVDGKKIANRVEPGKRPRSSMTPTFVFDEDGKLYMIIGSAGGANIIGYVAKVIVGVVDWNLDLQSAINLPNVINQNGPTRVEDRPDTMALSTALEAMGHEVSRTELMSGLNGIRLTPRGFDGGADPRRDGTAEAR
ncbi:MAG: gamma-glutamyltransferase [Alphaproteobacteria bacterium]|nr:MAG: gamma-glutamyltransferase [Alphaproteobacteria bacterium]